MDHCQLVIKVCTILLRARSFESGALNQGNISDMQDRGPKGLDLDTAVVDVSLLQDT